MKIVLNPKYEFLRDFVTNLPQTFEGQGEIIYDGRNIIKVIETPSLKVNVKSFQVPNIINKFIYGSLRESKAARSYKYAGILHENGIDTPEPIAYIEEQNGIVFGRSYFVTVQEDFDGLMREFQRGTLSGRENLLQQFAQFTARMHDRKILHLDYSPGNILYKKNGDEYRFYLVDLNRMYFGDVSMDRGCKSFCRLWGSDEMIAYIAAEYAKARNFDVNQCVELVQKYHRSFWIQFTKRHKDKSPYFAD